MMIGFEKCKWEHSCGYELCVPEFCKEYEAVPMTNADYIRSMSDEELADHFWGFDYKDYSLEDGVALTKRQLLKWFKMPYKEKEE